VVQSDRATFPCACTSEGCDNAVGRVAFNIERVRAHFVRTVMRLKREKMAENLARHYAAQNGEPPLDEESPSPTTTTSEEAHDLVDTRVSVGSSIADSSNDSGFDEQQQPHKPRGIQQLLAELADADGKAHAHNTSCIEVGRASQIWRLIQITCVLQVDAHGNTMGTFVCHEKAST